MKKRILCLVLTALLAAGAFAGCNSGGSPSSTAPEAGGSESTQPAESQSTADGGTGEEKVLRFSWWGGDARHEATLEAIALYEERNPGVTIEPEYGQYGGYLEKLYVQLASKTVPDIPAIDGKWVPDMLRNYQDSFVNLREVDVDLSGYEKDFLDLICGDGSFTLGAAMGINSYGVIYSTEFFEKFGLGDPENWTWEDYFEAGAKVQEQDPESHLLYNILNNYGYFFKYHIKQQTGLDIVGDDLSLQFTKEQATEAWEHILRMVETGTVPPFEESMPYATNYPHEVPKWLEGKYGMHITQGSNLSAQVNGSPFELKTANLPIPGDAVDIGWPISTGMLFGVYAYGGNVDEAVKFVDFMLNDDDAIRISGDTRGLPATGHAMGLLEADGVLMPQMVEFIDRYNAQGSSTENMTTVNAAILELTCEFAQQVAYKRMTPEEAAESYMQELEVVVKTME